VPGCAFGEACIDKHAIGGGIGLDNVAESLARCTPSARLDNVRRIVASGNGTPQKVLILWGMRNENDNADKEQ
jgi:hypothetical protein